MRAIVLIFLSAFVFISCDQRGSSIPIEEVNWADQYAQPSSMDSLENGSTYLPIYSQIYSIAIKEAYDLTVMVSIRNTSLKERIYLKGCDYYDSDGILLKSYLDQPVYLDPLQTKEIMIKEEDISGGLGSKFIFDWSKPSGESDPLFEAVMNSIAGQQGLSFISRGVRIN